MASDSAILSAVTNTGYGEITNDTLKAAGASAVIAGGLEYTGVFGKQDGKKKSKAAMEMALYSGASSLIADYLNLTGVIIRKTKDLQGGTLNEMENNAVPFVPSLAEGIVFAGLQAGFRPSQRSLKRGIMNALIGAGIGYAGDMVATKWMSDDGSAADSGATQREANMRRRARFVPRSTGPVPLTYSKAPGY